MENGLKLLYMSFGIIMFISAVTNILLMDRNFNNTYNKILYKSIDTFVVQEMEEKDE
ncbi:MAG: hypothetical protein K2M73_07680 [Lachnospiraceae bacterium]|nr:hypothetical protein [Lachnospiraceae bacterium]